VQAHARRTSCRDYLVGTTTARSPGSTTAACTSTTPTTRTGILHAVCPDARAPAC
jgi:hypothetical protein